MTQISEIFDSVNVKELDVIKKNIESAACSINENFNFRMIAFIQND